MDAKYWGGGDRVFIMAKSRLNVRVLRVYVSEYPCGLVPAFLTLRTADSPKLLARMRMLGSEEMVHGCGLGDM